MLLLQKPKNTEFYHTKKSFSFIVISLLILPFLLIQLLFVIVCINGYLYSVYNECYSYYAVSVA